MEENIEETEETDEKDEKTRLMTDRNKYVAIRMLELVFGAAFFFGIMWSGVGTISLTMPQFLALYGGAGALICELFARRLSPNVGYGEEED